MRNTPTTLKQLAEKRARTAFDLEYTRKIIADLSQKASKQEADLAALDRSIRLYDRKINPTLIAPINGWTGSYGKRGALKEGILELLKASSPNWLSSRNLEALVCEKFGIGFYTYQERRHWYKNSFVNLLRKLVNDGLIEREHDWDMARWRWKDNDSQGLDALTHAAKKANASLARPGP